MHRWMLLLALAAALLMALAPVVSRWIQSAPGTHTAMAHAMAPMAMAPSAPAVPPMSDAHAAHAGHMDAGKATAPDTDKPRPPDPHAAHGEACDYCTMASRLLPWLALLLVLAPVLYRVAPQAPRATVSSAGLRWPAHPVRGPPLFS